MDATDLALLLSGIELTSVKRRPRYALDSAQSHGAGARLLVTAGAVVQAGKIFCQNSADWGVSPLALSGDLVIICPMIEPQRDSQRCGSLPSAAAGASREPCAAGGDHRVAAAEARGTHRRNGKAAEAVEPFRQRPSERETDPPGCGSGVAAVRQQRGVPGRSGRGGGPSRSDRPDVHGDAQPSTKKKRDESLPGSSAAGREGHRGRRRRRRTARRTASGRSSATTRPRRWSTSVPSCTCW